MYWTLLNVVVSVVVVNLIINLGKEILKAYYYRKIEIDVPRVLEVAEVEDLSVFGLENGVHIENKSTIMKDIDEALGVNKAPDLEYIFVEPSFPENKKLYGALTGFGHAVVRYTMPSGEQKVMNIVGLKEAQMVNFLKPEDYFFGVSTVDLKKGEQCGIYHRAMHGVRIENVDPQLIVAMDKYFQLVEARANANTTVFNLTTSTVHNLISRMFYWSGAQEQGNCARYSSKGIIETRILPRTRLFPKSIFVEILEREYGKNPKNVNVVSYKRIKHAQRNPVYAGCELDAQGPCQPFHWVRSFIYKDLEKFANIIVHVPEDSTRAYIHENTKPLRITNRNAFYKHHHEILAWVIALSFFLFSTFNIWLKLLLLIGAIFFTQLWY